MIRTSTMMSNCGTRGTTTRSMRGYTKERVQNIVPKERGRRSGQDGGRGQKSKIFEVNKRVMENGEDKIDEHLATPLKTRW